MSPTIPHLPWLLSMQPARLPLKTPKTMLDKFLELVIRKPEPSKRYLPKGLEERTNRFLLDHFIPTVSEAFPKTGRPPKTPQLRSLLSSVMTQDMQSRFVAGGQQLAQQRLAASLGPIKDTKLSVEIIEYQWTVGKDISQITSPLELRKSGLIVQQLKDGYMIVTPAEELLHENSPKSEVKAVIDRAEKHGMCIHVLAEIKGDFEYVVRERSERGDGEVVFWDKRNSFTVIVNSSHTSTWKRGAGLTSSFRVADIDDLVLVERMLNKLDGE
ncbi:UNVERIFIED_CONTAM: hypothetical protein HDU68_008467 [Siphonaria sp. JEL0065]|nr:hypothetical protein HDU68_008467 [Siphonaria sp. JEL0065]